MDRRKKPLSEFARMDSIAEELKNTGESKILKAEKVIGDLMSEGFRFCLWQEGKPRLEFSNRPFPYDEPGYQTFSLISGKDQERLKTMLMEKEYEIVKFEG